MRPHIVMLCSLDTKGRESAYLRDHLETLGATTTLIDIGYGRPAELEATISAEEVARAAGSDIDLVRGFEDTGAASTLMMQGAIIRVHELLRHGRCDGIVSFGGASNTTVATGVMKSLPVGIPKMMISSAAAMPAYAARYFGSTDITMMNAIVDFSGLNDLTRTFLELGAAAVHGMAAHGGGAVDTSAGDKPVAVTTFRFSEDCSQAVVRELERRGYATIPFHAQGVGENALEDLVGQGLFRGVVDVVPAGLSEHMLGGNRAANADRLEGAGRAGIPQVVSTAGFDMISCGPIERRDADDPLWERLGLAERRISVPDRFRVEARTTAAEIEEIAGVVAEKLNRSSSPAAVAVPLRGWSSLSVEGAELHDPEADAAFVPALRRRLKPTVPILEVDTELNSEAFAFAMVDALHEMIEAAEVGR